MNLCQTPLSLKFVSGDPGRRSVPLHTLKSPRHVIIKSCSKQVVYPKILAK